MNGGFRNPPGIETAELAFVGDSFTEGGNVAEEQTFVRLVAEAREESGLNLGRSWYGPQQELVVLRRYALPAKPHAVIWVAFEGNDLKDADRYERTKDQLGEEEEVTARDRMSDWIKARRVSRVIRMARKKLQRWRYDIIYSAHLHGTMPTAKGVEGVEFVYNYVPDQPQQLPVGWEATRRSLRDAAALCAEHDARFLVVFIPIKFRVYGPRTTFPDPEKLAHALPGESYDQPGDFGQILAEYCAESGIDHLDVTEPLREAASRGEAVYSLRYDTHLDVAGHHVVADAILDRLGGGASPR